MEVNSQNINPPQDPIPIQEQTPTPPSNPVSNKPKLKLPILIAGIVIFLIVIGSASAAFFLPKSNTNQQKQAETTISPQPTATIGINPSNSPTSSSTSPTPDPTANWKTYTGSSFTFRYPPGWAQSYITVSPGTYPPLSEIIQTSPNVSVANNISADYMTFYITKPGVSLDEIKNFITKKYITSQLKVEKVMIENKSIEKYTGCLNPEACEIVTALILPLKTDNYIMLDVRVNTEMLNDYLSTIKLAD